MAVKFHLKRYGGTGGMADWVNTVVDEQSEEVASFSYRYLTTAARRGHCEIEKCREINEMFAQRLCDMLNNAAHPLTRLPWLLRDLEEPPKERRIELSL